MRRTPPAALAVATTSLAAALAVAVSAHAPAHGVRNGSVDGDQHPMVGVMVAQDELGNPMWDCSGTLVSPRVFVTAGHCTTDDHGVEAADVQVWFGAGPIDVDQRYVTDPDDRWCEDGSGLRYGFPCEGEAGALEVHTHPEYEPSEFWRHDLGVVVLDEGVELPEGYDYATLPEPGQFDGWRSNRKQTFDAVGYGRQHDYGQGAAGRESANLTERRLAHPRLVSINKPSVGDYAMELSGDTRTGGTCSGDSGGPNFLTGTTVVAGVTSYGRNAQTCSGSDGVYRLDGEDDVAFLAEHVPALAP